jgi:hypothetical protein
MSPSQRKDARVAETTVSQGHCSKLVSWIPAKPLTRVPRRGVGQKGRMLGPRIRPAGQRNVRPAFFVSIASHLEGFPTLLYADFIAAAAEFEMNLNSPP